MAVTEGHVRFGDLLLMVRRDAVRPLNETPSFLDALREAVQDAMRRNLAAEAALILTAVRMTG